MRKTDRILLAIVFLSVFWRLFDVTFFKETPPPLRQPAPKAEVAPQSPRRVVELAPVLVEPRASTAGLPTATIKEEAQKAKGSYLGTAFSLSEDGHWLTATHVATKCEEIWLSRETADGFAGRYPVRQWRAFQGMDVAVMDGLSGQDGLTIADQPVKKGERGYFFGYPHGVPSAGFGENLGHGRMLRSISREVEPTDFWVVKEVLPESENGLGGNSGGPVLNANGEVVGMLSASSGRRGRMLSSVLSEIKPLAQFSKPQEKAPHRLTPDNYAEYGQYLRRQGFVNLVQCRR